MDADVRLDREHLSLLGQVITAEAPTIQLKRHEAGKRDYGVYVGDNTVGLESGEGHVRVTQDGTIDLRCAKELYLTAPAIKVGTGGGAWSDLLQTIQELQARVKKLESR